MMMMKKEVFVIGALLLFALSAIPSWPQTGSTTAGIRGVITQNQERMSNLQIIFTNPNTGKKYKTKTDKKGEYFSMGMLPGSYRMEVIDANGGILYSKNNQQVNSADPEPFPIDLSKPEASGGVEGPGIEEARLLKSQTERASAENAKTASLNALVTQAQSAMDAQKWSEAATALKRLIEAYPETTRWELYKVRGDAEGHLQEYQDAAQTYEKGIQVAQAVAAGTAPDDPRNPSPDPARATAGLGQMLAAQGNAYLKLNKFSEAVACFKKAADTASNPAIAYYNLCAVEFNLNMMDDAVAACDKSIAANPGNAEAWFLKGSALSKTGKTETQAGTVEALNKYLTLDPNGAHAGEAKSILQKISHE
jgi:outer membrane protein assembly factor BamD (BamD/ComL family)